MTSSVDPTVERGSVFALLATLAEPIYEGVDQGTKLEMDFAGAPLPYRDMEPGSTIPAAQGRMLGVHEQAQPHIWAFQIHHVAPTRSRAVGMATSTDRLLIGWEPSTNSGPIGGFYFQVYDNTAKSGGRVQWIATRFYETQLGQIPDLAIENLPTPPDPTVPGDSDELVFTQPTPLATWTIAHNFGRLPVVEIYVGGEQVFADVDSNNSTVTISFSTPIAGVAILR